MGRRILILLAIFCVLAAAKCQGDVLVSQISEVLQDNKATIGIGAGEGVKQDMVFQIINDNKEQIGTLTILEAGADKSTGEYNMFNQGAAAPKPGAIVVFESDIAGSMRIAARAKRKPANIKIALLGFNDSFNAQNTDDNKFLAKKIASFIAYKLQWDTPFKFVSQNEVIGKTAGDVSGFYNAKGAGVSAYQRYNTEKIAALGREMGADYVIAGDVIKYMLEEHREVNKARRALNILSIAGGGATLESVKKAFTFSATIDIAVIDTQTGSIVWNQACDGEHKGSKWLEREIGSTPLFEVNGSYYAIAKTIDVQLRRTDDPIVFAGTEEGVGVMKAINMFVKSLSELL